MPSIRLGDFCCQGGTRSVDTANLGPNDLVLAREGKTELRFSPLGNRPSRPKLALVGITPGGQSEKFEKSLLQLGVERAAKEAASRVLTALFAT
jgi:hypothetical protein